MNIDVYGTCCVAMYVYEQLPNYPMHHSIYITFMCLYIIHAHLHLHVYMYVC